MAKAETFHYIQLTLNEKEARVLRDLLAHIENEPAEIGALRIALEYVGFHYRKNDNINGHLRFI